MSDLAKAVGFVHLHVHSSYSLLEGALKIAQLAELAKADRQPALALTDTGNLFVNVFVEPLDQRIDNYDRHDANNHAQKRQGRAEFMRPDSRGGQFYGLDKFHGLLVRFTTE